MSVPAVLGLVLLHFVGAAAQDAASCSVERIIDGDTFVCASGERVRLILVNTPEMGDAPLGGEARRRLVELMPPGTRVELEMDVGERDRYRRLLAYVRLPDGRMVNRVLAREGYAQVMVVPPNVRHVDRIRAAADSARAEGAGLWRGGGFRNVAPGDSPGTDAPGDSPGTGAPGDSPGTGAPGDPSGADAARRDGPQRVTPDGRGGRECEPAYPDVCIPLAPPDLDCGDVPFRSFQVVGPDPHRFDGDGDGRGCEG